MRRYLITRIQSSTQVQALISVIASVGEEPTSKEKTGPENLAEEDSSIQNESPPPAPSSNAILTPFVWLVSGFFCASLTLVYDYFSLPVAGLCRTRGESFYFHPITASDI